MTKTLTPTMSETSTVSAENQMIALLKKQAIYSLIQRVCVLEKLFRQEQMLLRTSHQRRSAEGLHAICIKQHF